MRRFVPLVLAAAAFATLALTWIVSDRRAAQRVYDVDSSLNTSKTGLSLAAGYLAREHKVNILTKPFARATLERDAVVFRVAEELPIFFDPEDLEEKQFGPARPKQRPLLDNAEEAFVRHGGRLVIAAPIGALAPTDVDTTKARKVFPIWPRLGDIELDEDAAGFTTLRPRMHAIFAAGKSIIVARERIGDGELFVVSTPELFANEHLPNGLDLLVALAGEKRPVYFDEVLHGVVSDDGALALLKEWNLGPFLLLLLAIAALLFWRNGKRVGHAEEEYRDTRSDAIDLVRSLGALYRGVTTDAEAIALYHEALTRTVAAQSGLRGEALHQRVDKLTGGLVPPKTAGRMPRAIFEKQLRALNDAFMRKE